MSPTQAPVEIEPMVFRLSPGNRRAARLVVPGVPLVLGAVWLIMQAANRPGPKPGFVLAATAAGLLLCVWVEYWRLTVDGAGIHRRTLLRSTHWPWEDFMLGRVYREDVLATFLFGDNATGKGVLSLGYLAENDAVRLLGLIDQLWVSPPPPDLPPELVVEVARRQKVTMTAQGIDSDWDGRRHAFRWDDVRRVRVERLTHYQQGFDALTIELPPFTVKLEMKMFKGGRYPMWKGPDGRTIATFFLNCVPEDRVEIVALSGPACSVDDYDARLQRIGDGLKERLFLVLCSLGLAVFLTAMFVFKVLPGLRGAADTQGPAVAALAVLAFVLMMTVPAALIGVALAIPRSARKARAGIEDEREAFLAEEEAWSGQEV